MKKLNIIRTSLFTSFLLALPTILLAQPSMPGNPSQAPIDGGLSILAAAGGAYAIKKFRDRTRSEEG